MAAPHDAPSLAQILEAVREWIETDVMSQTSGRLHFHARVAVNLLSTAERELAVGPLQLAAHQNRLDELGVSDDRMLAQAIRDGALDDRMERVRELVRASVVDKLAVANPKYLRGADRSTL